MGITRLKRKARRNKQTAAKRQVSMQQLNRQPVIKNIDSEAIKASFGAAPVKEEEAPVVEETKAEPVVEEAPVAVEEVTAETEEVVEAAAEATEEVAEEEAPAEGGEETKEEA